MSAQRGRDLLVKIANEDGAFVTLAGLRTKSLSFNSRLVDITHSESAQGWRELLPGAGVKSMQVSGAGIFRDGTSDALARSAFFSQEIKSFQLIIPDFGIIEGPFLITAMSYAGSYDGEAGYDVTLSSAGAPSFIEI